MVLLRGFFCFFFFFRVNSFNCTDLSMSGICKLENNGLLYLSVWHGHLNEITLHCTSGLEKMLVLRSETGF